ncbi:MAG: ATP-binding protein [Ilumatobacteraceae bacterium]
MAKVICPVVVGRGEELDQLRTGLAAACTGSGRMVFLLGEAGIGKSRLARELIADEMRGGVRVLRGRAVPSATHVAFRPIAEALAATVDDLSTGDLELAPWLPALARIVPGSGTHQGGPADDSPAAWGEAVVRALRRVSEPGGGLLVLEDLHWSDPETLAIVDHLSDNIERASVLCVITVRTDMASAGRDLARAVAARGSGVVLELSRLDDAQVMSMIELCGSDAAGSIGSRVVNDADGVPFLVEELLASPGVPDGFVDTVRRRLEDLEPAHRTVLASAATFGRQFDWRLLPAATGLAAEVVAAALEQAIGCQLLRVEGDGFSFRHALTRDAVLETVMPTRRIALAGAALSALVGANASLAGPQRDVVAMLAERAGQPQLAGSLYLQTGREALTAGALASATAALLLARDLLPPGDLHDAATEALVEAYAQAGHVDEAMEVGRQLTARIQGDGAAAVHLRLARAAIAGSRWPLASSEVDAALGAIADEPAPALRAELAICEAEIAFGADDPTGAMARARNSLAIAREAGLPDAACAALQLIGRCERLSSLELARAAFAESLAIATANGLTVHRLRAAHELGTLDMLDRGDLVKLHEARALGQQIGAHATVAVLDVELAAGYSMVGDLAALGKHADGAASLARQLGLDAVTSIAEHFGAMCAVLRLDESAVAAHVRSAARAAPDSRQTRGLALMDCDGLLALLHEDHTAARESMSAGMEILRDAHSASPSSCRGLWALLLCLQRDDGAVAAVAELEHSGVTVNRLNRGYVDYCHAVLAGRDGDHVTAIARVNQGDANLTHGPFWWQLGRRLVSQAARADGWGDPDRWLAEAAAYFEDHGYAAVATACRQQPAEGVLPRLWSRWSVTPREADVLTLVIEGDSNKEIAARLFVSVRTVEKHIESLLRKSSTRSRTHLATLAAQTSSGPP